MLRKIEQRLLVVQRKQVIPLDRLSLSGALRHLKPGKIVEKARDGRGPQAIWKIPGKVHGD
ncbi:MAG: hypothetical protein NTX87_07230 [Planctomycetota bacterium]|nr:hypothetical protein [Planctomycetota bacterium]